MEATEYLRWMNAVLFFTAALGFVLVINRILPHLESRAQFMRYLALLFLLVAVGTSTLTVIQIDALPPVTFGTYLLTAAAVVCNIAAVMSWRSERRRKR